MITPEIQRVLDAWTPYVNAISDWTTVVNGLEPKLTGCGPVYELVNPMTNRPDESFAVADMRNIRFAEPHYHTNGETEIYIVLTGSGLVVVGGQEHKVDKGLVVITPPDTAHFTVPDHDLVLAVINTPSFNPANYVLVTDTMPEVGYDPAQLDRLLNSQNLPN